MNKESGICIKNQKDQLRLLLKQLRGSLPASRKRQAASEAFDTLKDYSKSFSIVLSYASFRDELDTSRLNYYLAQTKRLVLSKVEKGHLSLFQVENLESQLIPNRWGLLEPLPKKCERIHPEQVELALVPGLGFDCKTYHRIGYGHGCYDRLLAQLPPQSQTWAIGFQEQGLKDLPISRHDIPLKALFLF